MSLPFFGSKMSAGLMFSFFVFLLRSVFAQRNPNHIYFLDKRNDFPLKGPDNPGNGPVVWEWKPHSGQPIQRLVTFYKDYYGRWNVQWSDHFRNNDLYSMIQRDPGTINLRIRNPTFELAGLFTWTQTQPRNKIRKQYEIFGIKVESSPQHAVVGSDVILSCTISKLSDTVSLQWKQRDSSQQNRRNTDHIRIKNTVYLIIKHVKVEDKELYVCEVQENGSIILTGKADFPVTQDLYDKSYTLYRSGTDHSELYLICYDYYHYYVYSYNTAAWAWRSHHLQNQEKEIASASKSEHINVNRTYFGNRLVPTMANFNGENFSLRIVPVLFEDAGVYTCSLGSYEYVTIKLITVKVTAEPSDAVTEGDTVTLTCSVSDVTESIRLVWINSDGKTVGEKTLNGWNGEEKSLRLNIQKVDRGKENWICALFFQNRPQVFVPYYLEPSGCQNYIYFFHQEGNFVFKGPDNPGNGPIVWEWRPHSGQQTTKQLGTFHREDQWWAVRWSDDYNKIPGISQRIHEDWGTLNLRIRNPTFELAGLFTWTQTQPSNKILKQCEIFGIKVETDSQKPVMGSDITLSCTISRLSDTVSLHWKQRDSSQQNRRNNTDEIHLNNTVYLIVRHVGAENQNLYTWEVQENGSIVLTGNINIDMDHYLYDKRYTLYRSGTDHSELYLICKAQAENTKTKWTWRSHHFQNQEKEIASTFRSQPLKLNRTYFGNRLVPTMANFNGKNFSVRIVPVLFEDAGVYTCSLGSYKFVTIKLITVKVTAEPSDAVTEGDTVTLTCSVSDVTESMRLVWINSDGKTVGEKTLNGRNGEEKSLRLNIQKVDRGRGNWICVLFYQNRPLVLVPYYLESSGSQNYIYFFHQEGNFVIKGPDNPGNGPIVWEWRPHSGQQTTKQLGTFHREGQRWAVQWSDDYNNIPGISQRIREDWGTLNLRIRNPTFELAGLFTWTQTQPSNKTLKQYEIFGIKVETDSQRPVMGNDITLSCTISRLSDTVSLHWKQRVSSQQNWRNNTDEIHLNNTVYLIVSTKNQNLYMWEVQENDSIVLTGSTNVDVDQDLNNKSYTLYRSGTDHSELYLICEAQSEYIKTKWTWRSHHFQNQEEEIASTFRSKPIRLNRTYFGTRLVPTMANFNRKNFIVRIVPVLFEDAGVYTCSLGPYPYVTIKLITVKVRAEPSDAVTEGDTVTLTCSVSDVTESMRLVWINSDGKTVEEKTFKEQKQEQKFLRLIIQKADRDRSNWTCVLFHQNSPKVLIPYYPKVNNDYTFKHTNVVIFGSLALLLIIILAVVLCLRKFKAAGLENQRQKPLQPRESIEDASQLYSNANEIQQIQGDNETSVHFSEYASVNKKAKKEDTEREDIHYASVTFQKKAPGSRHGTQGNQQSSDTNLTPSKEDDSSVIYAQIAQAKYK
ncbi:uncharacterized protein [Heptranchias perlo]|uniref:uncharacterized protein n=1 Tax=Heptranchias perlo TaxID=212740 RepID=UPI00355AA935